MTRYTAGMDARLNFEDARAIVRDLVGVRFEGPGSFHVAEYGWEDESGFVVVAGSYEGIVLDDPEYQTRDDTTLIVDRYTGELTREHHLRILERLRNMTPIGEHPPDD